MPSMTAAFRSIAKYMMMTLTAKNVKKGIRSKMELVQIPGAIQMAMIQIGIAKNARQATALTTISCVIQVNQAFALQENISWTRPAYRFQWIIV